MLLPPLPSIIKSLNSKPTPLPPPPSTPPPPPPQSNITSHNHHNHHHHNRKETADLKTTTTTTTNPVKSNQHFVDADTSNKRPTKTIHISSTNNKSPTPVNIEGKSPSFDDRHVRSNVEFSKRYFFLLHSIVVYFIHAFIYFLYKLS